MKDQNNNSNFQINWISKKLEKAEKSGFTISTKEEILAESKSFFKE